MRHSAVGLLLVAVCAPLVVAQGDPLVPPRNGPVRVDAGWHAFVGARVLVEPGVTIERGLVVIRAGRIVAVRDLAGGGEAPAGAQVHDCEGMTLHAGFLEPFLEVDTPDLDEGRAGAHANPRVQPDRDTAVVAAGEPKGAAGLRKLGFTAAAIAPSGGIFRGHATVVSLGKAGTEKGSVPARTHAERVYQSIGFARGGNPGSQMGNIALLRQTFHDARWTLAWGAGEASCLRSLGGARGVLGEVPMLLEADNELELLRHLQLAQEFGLKRAMILGSGSEYRRLAAVSEGLRRAKLPLILPLAFPKKPTLKQPSDFATVELQSLMAWEQAPSNPARLANAGVELVLTSTRADRSGGSFRERLAKAIALGWAPAEALAALTTRPARLLGVGDRMGRITPGYSAGFVLREGDPFDAEGRIAELWIDGVRHAIEAPKPASIDGAWTLELMGPKSESLAVAIADGRMSLPVAVLAEGEEEAKPEKLRLSRQETDLSFTHDREDQRWFFAGRIASAPAGEPAATAHGTAVGVDGQRMEWRLVRRTVESGADEAQGEASAEDEEPAEEEATVQPATAELPPLPGYPFGPYARRELPPVETLAIVGATLWTSAEAGIVEEGALVVDRGRIAWVGPAAKLDAALDDLKLSGDLQRLDGSGLHLTPGLIDCHSHTGISGGVNEMGQTVTSEVRIRDVTNPDAISWYRQLAGGVTTVNNLHGSANPIGGQSQTNKNRWGAPDPRDLHFEGSKPGIKFALGENVVRSRERYPSTRMGVEVMIRDRFHAAQAYAAARERQGSRVRRDLELDALVEILRGERWIHCHSYRQDEILMLCEVAKSFGFKIGTFQHVLEGYKVAEAIREVAVGASAFSDWWAYKVEVQDAIPWAGAIMHEAGVNVSFNSDSDELARRMNLEAAKAVQYGGLDRAEALHFVTRNPAIQLGVIDRVGTLEVGKDADFVLWTADPLSSFARAKATWIDGRRYFSLEDDARAREHIRAERERLITLVLGLKEDAGEASGEAEAEAGNQPGGGGLDHRLSRLSGRERQRLREHHLQLLRSGVDPENAACGRCDDHVGGVR